MRLTKNLKLNFDYHQFGVAFISVEDIPRNWVILLLFWNLTYFPEDEGL